MRETLTIPLILWTLWAIIAGIFGSYIYYQKLNAAVGGISHASLGGIWIGYFLFSIPIYWAYIFAPFLGLLLGFITLKYKQNKDAIISLIWAGGMSLGMVLSHLAEEGHEFAHEWLAGHEWHGGLEEYLFGNIFSTTNTDIWILLGILLLCIVFFVVFRKILNIISYDMEFARVQKLPYTLVYYSFMVLLALVIVALTKIIGIVLILAIFALPTLTSINIKKNLTGIMRSNIFLGLVAIWGGMISSYYVHIPASALVVGILIVLYGVSLIIKKR